MMFKDVLFQILCSCKIHLMDGRNCDLSVML